MQCLLNCLKQLPNRGGAEITDWIQSEILKQEYYFL